MVIELIQNESFGPYQPIAGSMLGVPSMNPEVVVTVNRQRSGCIDTTGSCDFRFEKDQTGVITSVNLQGETEMIEGKKILVDLEINQTLSQSYNIEIGGAECSEITLVSQTGNSYKFECTVGFVLESDSHILKFIDTVHGATIYKLRFNFRLS